MNDRLLAKVIAALEAKGYAIETTQDDRFRVVRADGTALLDIRKGEGEVFGDVANAVFPGVASLVRGMTGI